MVIIDDAHCHQEDEESGLKGKYICMETVQNNLIQSLGFLPSPA